MTLILGFVVDPQTSLSCCFVFICFMQTPRFLLTITLNFYFTRFSPTTFCLHSGNMLSAQLLELALRSVFPVFSLLLRNYSVMVSELQGL